MNTHSLVLMGKDAKSFFGIVLVLMGFVLLYIIYYELTHKQRSFNKPWKIKDQKSGTFYKVLEIIGDKILLEIGISAETITKERWFNISEIPLEMQFIGQNFCSFIKDDELYFNKCTPGENPTIIDTGTLIV